MSRADHNIGQNTLTLSTPVTQRVVSGADVFLACDIANPTPYAEWPDPATGDAVLRLTSGGTARGGLTFAGSQRRAPRPWSTTRASRRRR